MYFFCLDVHICMYFFSFFSPPKGAIHLAYEINDKINSFLSRFLRMLEAQYTKQRTDKLRQFYWWKMQ